MKKILYSIAEDINGTKCIASQSVKGQKYFCIVCGSEMILRKSENRLRRPHFAHKNLSNSCTPESALHKYYKEKLYNRIKKNLVNESGFEFSWDCQKCGEKHKGNLLKKVDSVQLEKSLGPFRPDITLYKDKIPFIAIEIVVTHSPEPEAKLYYSENDIILMIFSINSFEEAENIEQELIEPSLETCINPICEHHNIHKNKRILKIVDTNCWRCEGKMKAAFIDFEYGEGPQVFTSKEIKIARSNGVILIEHFSKTMAEKYLANTCKYCNAFIGINFISPLTRLRGKEIQTGYICTKCKYEKNEEY